MRTHSIPQDKIQLLLQSPLFESFTQPELEQIFSEWDVQSRHYGGGSIIVRQDEALDFFYLLLEGEAIIARLDPWGKRHILAEVHSGELCGESFALFPDVHSRVEVCARLPCQVLAFPAQKLLEPWPQLAVLQNRLQSALLQLFARKNLLLNEKIGILSERSIEARVLAFCANQLQNKTELTIKLPFSRQELADYLAVDRSALSRSLSEMRRRGLIDYHGRYLMIKRANE